MMTYAQIEALPYRYIVWTPAAGDQPAGPIQPSSIGRDRINAADFRVHYQSVVGGRGWEATEIDNATLVTAMLRAAKWLENAVAYGVEEHGPAAVVWLRERAAGLVAETREDIIVGSATLSAD